MKRLFTLLTFMLAFAVMAKSQNYAPDKERNLTIVYLLPSDVPPTTVDYEQRISKVMIYIQKWYSDQMHIYGYDDANGKGKTFGLVQDKGMERVQITTIQSANNKAYFAGGSQSKMQTEVNNYFGTHPGLKTSKHVLIFYPTFSPAGPYSGYGMYCMLSDEVKLDVANLGKTGYLEVSALGGTAHELGHALNLSHNAGKLSDYTNASKGVALMGAGVYNFSRADKPAFLTASDCAILNVNEIFNENPDVNKIYYGAVQAGVSSIHSVYNPVTRNIEVSGRFFTNTPVNSVLLYNDPNWNGEGTTGDTNYNAITWETKPIGVDSFYVNIPIDELTIKYPYVSDGCDPYVYPYLLRIGLVYANGNAGGMDFVSQSKYSYSFNDERVPIITYSTPVNNTAVDRTGWTVVALKQINPTTSFSDETASSGTGAANNLIDNDYTTYWRSKTSGFPSGGTNAFPHEVIIDTKLEQNYVGWSCHQLMGLSNAVKTVEVLGSNDNAVFALIGTYTVEAYEGVRYFNFDGYKKYRYFKIKVTSGTGNSAALSDVKFYVGPDPANIVLPTSATLVSNVGWTVKAGNKGTVPVEDEENSGNASSGTQRADDVIDNNPTTYWHSKYSDLTATEGVFNHEIMIDTKSVQRFTSWAYQQRAGLSRSIKDIDVYAGDNNENYTLIGSYTLLNNTDINKLSFGVKNFRYFKIVAKNAYDVGRYAALAEVKLYNDPQVTVLPVELLSFNAIVQGNTVKLNWATASETNSDYFDVVRYSTSAQKNAIGRKIAAGVSSAKLNYHLTDYNPLPGVSYYQLLQYDKNGKLAVSSDVKLVNVLENPSQLNVLSVTGSDVVFNVYSVKEGAVSFYITNMLGQRIIAKKVNLSAGNNQLSLPINGSGMHLLTADFGTEIISKKFIK